MFDPIIELLFPWQAEINEARSLALEVEERVRYLSDLPAKTVSAADVCTILRSTRLLLDRFIAQQERAARERDDSGTDTGTVEATVSTDAPEPSLAATLPVEKPQPEPEPTGAALELIKLRDYVLMANPEDLAVAHKILESLYRKLGQLLEKEGLTPLEATGAFNYERQQVVETEETDDPNLDEMVADTVRPGYSFNERLIRPQEVIVYTYTTSNSDRED